MFRWLPDSTLTDHGKIVTSFWNRIAALDHDTAESRAAVATSLVLTWRDFLDEIGSLDGYRDLPRDRQRKLLVRLIDYEARCLKDGPQSEAIAAELLSYFIAMLAAGDREEEQRMRPPLVELARLHQPDFSLDSHTASSTVTD